MNILAGFVVFFAMLGGINFIVDFIGQLWLRSQPSMDVLKCESQIMHGIKNFQDDWIANEKIIDKLCKIDKEFCITCYNLGKNLTEVYNNLYKHQKRSEKKIAAALKLTNNDYNKAIRMTFGNVIDYLNEFKSVLETKKLELEKSEGSC